MWFRRGGKFWVFGYFLSWWWLWWGQQEELQGQPQQRLPQQRWRIWSRDEQIFEKDGHGDSMTESVQWGWFSEKNYNLFCVTCESYTGQLNWRKCFFYQMHKFNYQLTGRCPLSFYLFQLKIFLMQTKRFLQLKTYRNQKCQSNESFMSNGIMNQALHTKGRI